MHALVESKRTLEEYDGLDEALPIDSCEGRTYLLVHKETGAHVKLSSGAYHVLRGFRSGRSFEQMADELRKSGGDPSISGERLCYSYIDVINRLYRLHHAPSQTNAFTLWFKHRVIAGSLSRRIGRSCSFLYDPRLAALLLVAISAALWSIRSISLKLNLDTSAFFPAYCLFLLSLLAHEFGHASASARFGVDPGDIGFGIYLIYPSFYTDVTATWRLSRLKRIVVDLGGNYFQFTVGSLFLACFHYTRWQPFRLAFLMILYTGLFSLNPIFKFDGYWVVADLLGVTNLASQPQRIFRRGLDRLFHRPSRPLPWSNATTSLLFIYSSVSICVWSYFILHLVPSVWIRMSSLERRVLSALALIHAGGTPRWADLRQIIISVFLLVISFVMVWRAARSIVLPAWARLRPGQSAGAKLESLP